MCSPDRPAGRFEFRIFAPALPALAAALAARATAQPDPESHEIYLLPAADDCNVKLRGGALEGKRRVGRDGDLEQWQPFLREPLPIEDARLREAVWPALGVVAPPAPAPVGAPDLVALARSAGVAVVFVTKRRQRYALEEVQAEHTALALPQGVRCESVALEAEAPEAIRAALRVLGLAEVGNTSYVRALRALAPADGAEG